MKQSNLFSVTKDFVTSDKIRNQLAELGVAIKDEKNWSMSWSIE